MAVFEMLQDQVCPVYNAKEFLFPPLKYGYWNRKGVVCKLESSKWFTVVETEEVHLANWMGNQTALKCGRGKPTEKCNVYWASVLSKTRKQDEFKNPGYIMSSRHAAEI